MSQPRSPILATKLFAPRLPAVALRRDRILARLDGILHHPLTLISAPAGFGKTTAIGAWLAERDVPHAWLSLEARDGDLARFLRYLVAAVRTLLPEAGRELDELLTSMPLPPLEPLLTPLINDLAASDDEVVLVLDDYHEVAGSDVHEALLFLMEHLPDSLHLVLVTRIDPSFPLSRFRVGGRLLELRAEDLRFTPAESATLFNDMLSLDLSPAQIDQLDERTEGWIAGIQMAALSLRGRADVDRFIADFTGADRYVLGYLLEEVLGRRAPELERALLEISILDRFNAGLCRRLTGLDSGSGLIDLLARENLFLVPLDAVGEWYRYHHLFSELLRHRLARLYPDSVPELHRRAALWLEEHGQIGPGLAHSLTSGDAELLAGMLERHWRYVIGGGAEEEGLSLDELLAAVPEDRFARGPKLPLVRCWTVLEDRRFDEAERLLALAERALEDAARDDEYFEAAGQILFIRAIMARDRADADQTIVLGERALELLPDRLTGAEDYHWHMSLGMMQKILGAAYEIRGDYRRAEELFEDSLRFDRQTRHRQSVILSLANLGKHAVQKGKLSVAERALRELRELDAAASHIAGMPVVPYQIAARISLDRFELDEALEAVDAGIAMPARHVTTQLFDLYRLRAQIHAARGDMPAAAGTLEAMERIPIPEPEGRLSLVAPTLRAWLGLLDDDLADACEWVSRHFHGTAGETAATRRTFMLKTLEDLIYGRYLIVAGRCEDALAFIVGLVADLERAGFLSAQVEALVLETWLREAMGDGKVAEETLDSALHLAAREEVIRPFAMDRRRIAPVLARIADRFARNGGMRAYLDRVLDLVHPDATAGTAGRRVAGSKLVEPLTAREVEILELMAQGHSNRKIAERLYVSVNTVKTHVAHLFEKLGARSRVEALLRARESEILD